MDRSTVTIPGMPINIDVHQGSDRSSEALLAKRIGKMDKQTPADAKVPGWTTLKFPDLDPDCKLCNGDGYLYVPNDAYCGDNPYLMGVPCSCLKPQKEKPWRREPEKEQETE